MTTRANGGLNLSEEREGQQTVPAHGRNQMHGPDRRNLQLRIQSMFPDSFFTERNVEGQGGAQIHVKLIDTSTGLVVRSGPESCVKLKVVVVEGDFNDEDDDDDWTQEVFESREVKERKGKRPLLIGNLYVRLEGGEGTLGEFSFTDNSSWTRSKKFRLGVKVASGLREGIRVLEAITNPFVVKECRGEVYKKRDLPAFDDDVWRLKKIRKNGPFHKRLNDHGIFIIKDFLSLLGTDPKGLREILGISMREKMWETLVQHAKTGLVVGDPPVPFDQQATVPDQPPSVEENFSMPSEGSGLVGGPHVPFDQQAPVPDQPPSVEDPFLSCLSISMPFSDLPGQKISSFCSAYPPQMPHFDSPPSVSRGGVGYDHENFGNGYPVHSHRSNAQMQLESNADGRQMQLMSSSHQSQITRNDHMSQPESASCFGSQSIGSPGLPSNLISYDDQSAGYNNNRGADEFFSEEEICMGSHEMLENGHDMQQQLCLLGMGATPANASNDGYPCSSYIQPPSTNFNCEVSPGQAVVGWLKLKAALRWGIFIRKKAAERRAQLVELED